MSEKLREQIEGFIFSGKDPYIIVNDILDFITNDKQRKISKKERYKFCLKQVTKAGYSYPIF